MIPNIIISYFKFTGASNVNLYGISPLSSYVLHKSDSGDKQFDFLLLPSNYSSTSFSTSDFSLVKGNFLILTTKSLSSLLAINSMSFY